MKIEMTIELDLPDNCAEMPSDELRQVLYDAYVNYAAVSHAKDAVKWCAKAKVGTDEEKPAEKRIFPVSQHLARYFRNRSLGLQTYLSSIIQFG